MRRVVLITGVAGGIGSATARVFCDAGWHVVGVDRRAAHQQEGVGHYIQADVSDPGEMESLFNQIRSEEGCLDALVNNAAVQVCKSLLQTTTEEWDRVMTCNVRSAFIAAKHAYHLLKETQGAIVNVSSVHAVATSVGICAYAASKGALLALTRAMALEFGPDGIRVNAILPGAVDTMMLHEGLTRGDVQHLDVNALLRGLGKKHIMGRVGQPEEIGRSILFLADSTQSSFITGQGLTVDGGATARLSTE